MALNQGFYSNIVIKSGNPFQSLAKNHPFFNANKRMVFTALEVFLEKTDIGYTLSVEIQEEIDLTVEIADQENKIEINEISI